MPTFPTSSMSPTAPAPWAISSSPSLHQSLAPLTAGFSNSPDALFSFSSMTRSSCLQRCLQTSSLTSMGAASSSSSIARRGKRGVSEAAVNRAGEWRWFATTWEGYGGRAGQGNGDKRGKCGRANALISRVQDDPMLDDVAEAVLNSAENIAMEAGDYIRSRVGRIKEVSSKAERCDLVTEVDRESERLISRRINSAFPLHRFVGEESISDEDADVAAILANKGRDEWTWIVDPLDGTLNFVGGIPMCAVSIGVARGSAFEVGVVYNPFSGEIFSARRGEGSYLNGKRLVLHASEDELEDVAVAVGFPSNPVERSKMTRAIAAVAPHSRTIRAFGSAALHMSYVAAGRLGCFFEHNLKAWDVAGAWVILEEAGGKVTSIDGGDLSVGGGSVLASNGSPRIHDRILDLIQ